MDTRKQRKKINIAIDANLHREIKIAAAKRFISMSIWIERQLARGIGEEKKYDSESDLQKTQERI